MEHASRRLVDRIEDVLLRAFDNLAEGNARREAECFASAQHLSRDLGEESDALPVRAFFAQARERTVHGRA